MQGLSRPCGGASRASVAEGGGALWRARPKAASPQRALRYRKVLRACSKSERCIPLWGDAIRDPAHRSSFSPCLDGRARSPVPRRFSRERFRPRLGTITHRQAGQTGGRQATQQVLAVHAGSAFRGSAEQDTRGRHGPVHVEAAHRRLFGAIPACLSAPPPACERCSSSSSLATRDELLHIGWSSTSRAAQYEAHGLQLACRTCAGRSGRRVCGTSASPRLFPCKCVKLGRRPTPYCTRTTPLLKRRRS